MSTLEENITAAELSTSARKPRLSPVADLLKLLSSVRFGVTLLCLLALACFLGMVIMQQNVDGFENYFATLTPAQKVVYSKLGLFNIYHSWYFNALLAILSLNIVLASVDRFPRTWRFITKPPVAVPVRWLDETKHSFELRSELSRGELVKRATASLLSIGWSHVRTEQKARREFVFAESGAWNRLGAYAVHVGLLTIFLGGFLTAQLGTTGNLPLAPGESSDLIFENVVDLDRVNEVTKRLPFEVTFTDIEQRLIRNDGSLAAGNTIDWVTRFTIKDEFGVHEGKVQMNQPLDYRGYRFFQASYIPIGRARSITVDAKPEDGSAATKIEIPRNGSQALPDGTVIRFDEFRGNFRIGPEDPNEDTSSYPNPGAILQIQPPGGTAQTAYAFGPQMASLPVAKKPVAGYTFALTDFEKVGDRHILSVQRDPGATVVYVGFALLCLTLVAVFFFAHQRVWVVIDTNESGESSIVAGGDTNRNEAALVERLARLRSDLAVRLSAKEEL